MPRRARPGKTVEATRSADERVPRPGRRLPAGHVGLTASNLPTIAYGRRHRSPAESNDGDGTRGRTKKMDDKPVLRPARGPRVAVAQISPALCDLDANMAKHREALALYVSNLRDDAESERHRLDSADVPGSACAHLAALGRHAKALRLYEGLRTSALIRDHVAECFDF